MSQGKFVARTVTNHDVRSQYGKVVSIVTHFLNEPDWADPFQQPDQEPEKREARSFSQFRMPISKSPGTTPRFKIPTSDQADSAPQSRAVPPNLPVSTFHLPTPAPGQPGAGTQARTPTTGHPNLHSQFRLPTFPNQPGTPTWQQQLPTTNPQNPITWPQQQPSSQQESEINWSQQGTGYTNVPSWPQQPTTSQQASVNTWIQQPYNTNPTNAVSWAQQPSTSHQPSVNAWPQQYNTGYTGATTWPQQPAPEEALTWTQQYSTDQANAITWSQQQIAEQQYAYTTSQTWENDSLYTDAWSPHAFIADITHTGKQSTLSQPRPVITNKTSAPPAVVEEQRSRLDRSMPLLALLCNIALIAAVIWMETNNVFLMQRSMNWESEMRRSLNDVTNNKDISPLLFGTNMALFQDGDEPMLNSHETRQLLKDIGVRIIRMPTRSTLKPETQIAAAHAIKAIGAVPLIVINGPESKENVLETNKILLQRYTQVFGNQTVYYEFGNESDLQGVKAEKYVKVWNEVIPTLKQLYPTAKFIAPDMYQFNRRYLKTVVKHANPRPDGVSWHEYTCSMHWTAELCLANIDTWSVHFAQARAAMQEAIGTTLPIWITEWNYASDQQLHSNTPFNDGKYNNPAFMKAWTTKAMKSLIDNRAFAAMQYFATNRPMPLILDNKTGIEGEIFRQNYKKVMIDGQTPPPPSPNEPSALKPSLNPPPTISFERQQDWVAWASVGDTITQPIVSSDRALDGKFSLRAKISNKSEDDTPYITVPPFKLNREAPKAKQMISAHVFVANPNALMNAKIFVSDSEGHWHFVNELTLISGKWNRIWYALPENFTQNVAGVGIQFNTNTPGVSTDVYIDAVRW
jgi:hypothetical protein